MTPAGRRWRARELDLSRVRTVSLRARASKVGIADLAGPPRRGRSFRSFMKSLPPVLAARDLDRLAGAMAAAARGGKGSLLMMGAHVIKTGLSPVILDLIRMRAVTAVAMNGAGAVHDLELASVGRTSEDVARGLKDGTFGMARETGRFMADALSRHRGEGFGLAVGRAINEARLPYRRFSILASCAAMGVPATVHVALGTDIVHQQPSARGEDIGRESMCDFRKLCGVVAALEGGVVVNAGSAVILPEAFLKALTVARNLGHRVRRFTAANLDMIQAYRPRMNVLLRPTAGGGTAIAITGHHEITIPLLAQAVAERTRK